MNREPYDERGHDDQSDGERKNWPAVMPQRRLVGVFRLVVEKRCDEQHEEELGVEADFYLRGCENGDDQPKGYLDKRR